ncbi:MAG: glycosyltransferase family 2 protein [Proteobacteria bacterium]|nr:glycosyltransferase family 2 protein [Pseudomonadota bacterium]
MPTPLPISVFIITLNEADRLATTILSVRGWVDEVVVIDSGSTDNTLEVAASLGAKIGFHPWRGYGPQKRYAEGECKNRWLMNLDADEEVSPALAAEIQAMFAAGGPQEAGYLLRIRDLLPGEKSLSRFAHTNFVLRLYDRTQGSFSDSPVHDSVQMAHGAATRILDNAVLHRSYRSWAHVIEKMNHYTSMQAENLRKKKGMRFAHARLITEFPFAFFKDYCLRGYALRGWRGFINSVLYAFGRFTRIAKYLELRD